MLTYLTLIQLSQPIFDAIQSTDEKLNVANDGLLSLKNQLLVELENFSVQAINMSFESKHVQDAQYALAAFVDEKIITTYPKNRASWIAQTLTYQLFEDSIAGENFFNRLDKLLQNFDERSRFHMAVIALYYHCLMFGFQGKYRVLGLEHQEPTLEKIRTIFKEKSHSNKGVDGNSNPDNSEAENLVYGGSQVKRLEKINIPDSQGKQVKFDPLNQTQTSKALAAFLQAKCFVRYVICFSLCLLILFNSLIYFKIDNPSVSQTKSSSANGQDWDDFE